MGDTSYDSGDRDSLEDGVERTLTRRDAIGALAAAGVTAVAGCSLPASDNAVGTGDGADDATPAQDAAESSDATAVEDHELRTMRSLATVLYPSQIDVTEGFLETYLYSRIVEEESYGTEVTTAVETLDSLAREQYDGAFRTLTADQQESVVVDAEVRSADSVADGTDVERLNYYLVDELLFAFYASPAGGDLVGNANPRGWPGGYGVGSEAQQ